MVLILLEGALLVLVAYSSRSTLSFLRVGELLSPCGGQIQVNLNPDSGSVHSNGYIDWLAGARGKEKKATFRSKTVFPGPSRLIQV